MAKRYRSPWFAVFVLLAGALTARSADAPADSTDSSDKPAAEKVTPLGEVTGVLHKGAGSQQQMTLHVTLTYLEENPAAARALAHDQRDLLHRQQQILAARNPYVQQRELAGLVRELQHAAGNKQNLRRVREMHKDVPLTPDDSVQVRTMHLPPVYDDKGNPRKYTADELKGLKGDSKLPGYQSDLDSLQSGQTVTARLVRKKVKGEEKIVATVIVIVNDTTK